MESLLAILKKSVNAWSVGPNQKGKKFPAIAGKVPRLVLKNGIWAGGVPWRVTRMPYKGSGINNLFHKRLFMHTWHSLLSLRKSGKVPQCYIQSFRQFFCILKRTYKKNTRDAMGFAARGVHNEFLS